MRTYLTEPLKQEMTAWRHDIHQHPELGFKENRTAEKVAELLSSFGIETYEGIGGTGIVGVLKKGNGNRAIGLRADLDALPIQERGSCSYRSVHDGIANAHGARATVEYSYEFVALVNSEDETIAAIDAAEHTVGAENVDGNCRTNTVSEDFAQFLKQVPGCFILIGNGDEDDDRPLHNPFYDYKDANLVVGADYWVNLVQRQLLKG